jgi:hypothetical protein
VSLLRAEKVYVEDSDSKIENFISLYLGTGITYSIGNSLSNNYYLWNLKLSYLN